MIIFEILWLCSYWIFWIGSMIVLDRCDWIIWIIGACGWVLCGFIYIIALLIHDHFETKKFSKEFRW